MNFNENVANVVKEKIENSKGITLPSLIIEMEKEGISSLDTGIAVDFLLKKSLIKESSSGVFVSINGIVGDNMNQKNNVLNKEEKEFRKLVCDNKGKIYDAQKDAPFLVHRGAQIAFAGCGEEAFRYKVSLALGFSDKKPVETKVCFLDWNDSALYDEGGIADQIREILGTTIVQQEVSLKPVSVNIGGK